jgi:hypothetical protein
MAAAKAQMLLRFGLACEAALKMQDTLLELNNLLFDEELEEKEDHLLAIRDKHGPIEDMMRKWSDYIESVDALSDKSDESSM